MEIDILFLGAISIKKTTPIVTDEHYDDRPRGTRYGKQRTLQTRFESLGERTKEFLEGLREDRQGKLRDQMISILQLVNLYSKQEVYEAIERCCVFRNLVIWLSAELWRQKENIPKLYLKYDQLLHPLLTITMILSV